MTVLEQRTMEAIIQIAEELTKIRELLERDNGTNRENI